MSTDLADQVVVVVGGTRGIGAAIARDLASAGSQLVIVGRDIEAGQAVADSITDGGSEAHAVRCDVTNRDECDSMVAEVAERFGRIDTLFANQGVSGPGKTMTAWADRHVAQCLDVNLVGTLHLAQAAEALLAANGGGRFIVTGSGTGHENVPGLGMYGISKAAVAHLVRQLSLEWRSKNVAVNELVPGPVRTTMTGFADEQAGPEGSEPTYFEIYADEAGEWLKDPRDVVPLARLLAQFPTDGPSGQVFSLSGRVI